MSYDNPGTPRPQLVTPTAERKHRLPWLLGALGVIFALCLGGVALVAAFGGSDKPTAGHAIKLAPPASAGAAGPVGSHEDDPAPRALTTSDIRLTVKTTKKDCFGSAGCNVEYSLRASLTHTPGTDCAITYEVHGLDDAQVGTLDMDADGKYTQDDFQSGQTGKASAKLTAKVTDVDCS